MAETRPLEILVIDDDPSIRDLLVAFLSAEHVDTARDGQEGIDMYVARYDAAKTDGTKKPYDLVLTDLKMPRANGADVTQKVKELSPATPVYVITGFEKNEEYARMAEELGLLKPDGVIQKPFEKNDLISLIEQVRAQINSTQNLSGYNLPQPYQS